MAFSKFNSVVAFALVLTVFEGCSVRALTPTMAPSMTPTTVPAPSLPPTTAMSPGPDCFTVLLNMSDCLSYVEQGSNETVPAKECCGELAGLVESSPICLCQLLSNPSQAGLSIELSKALNLPYVCNVSTPPVSTCAIFGYPVEGPEVAPAPVFGYPVEGPEEAPAPGDQPTQRSPSSAPPSSGSSSVIERKSFAYLLLSLAFASLPMFS